MIDGEYNSSRWDNSRTLKTGEYFLFGAKFQYAFNEHASFQHRRGKHIRPGIRDRRGIPGSRKDPVFGFRIPVLNPVRPNAHAQPKRGMNMNASDLCWDTVWKSNHEKKKSNPGTAKPLFGTNAPLSSHGPCGKAIICLQVLDIMNPQPGWTVLDMGCAAGTLAIPLAGKVRSVTAVDPSPRMRDLLRQQCEAKGIDNIRIVDGSWGAGLGNVGNPTPRHRPGVALADHARP